jgi:hypothetical protein
MSDLTPPIVFSAWQPAKVTRATEFGQPLTLLKKSCVPVSRADVRSDIQTRAQLPVGVRSKIQTRALR